MLPLFSLRRASPPITEYQLRSDDEINQGVKIWSEYRRGQRLAIASNF